MLLATHPHERTDRTLTAGSRTCHHVPPCPPATAPGRHAARTVATVVFTGTSPQAVVGSLQQVAQC